MLVHSSEQTLPQLLLKQTSTLPSYGALPPANRMSPFVQLASLAIYIGSQETESNNTHITLFNPLNPDTIMSHHLSNF